MSAPESIPTVRRLIDEIHSCYGALLRITRRLADTLSVPMIERALSERESLLRDIEARQASLAECAQPAEIAEFRENGLIRDQVATISVLDRAVSAKIAGRLQEIRNELSGLWGVSNAAKAYIRHARF